MKKNETTELQFCTSEGSAMYSRPIAYNYDFYLSGPVLAASEYTDWFDKMRNATRNDNINIYINSGGGMTDTALQFMSVMAKCEAHITCSVEGSCMSAATMIFLQGDELHISENTLWMFHNYSGGSAGKGGEMFDNIMFERSWSERLLHSVYKDFLTDAEIKSMLDNKDIWMHGDEVIKRVSKAIKARNAAAAAAGESDDIE